MGYFLILFLTKMWTQHSFVRISSDCVDQLQSYIKVIKTWKFAWNTLHGSWINKQLDEAGDCILGDALDILFFEKERLQLWWILEDSPVRKYINLKNSLCCYFSLIFFWRNKNYSSKAEGEYKLRQLTFNVCSVLHHKFIVYCLH